jgi:hypothetical protein
MNASNSGLDCTATMLPQDLERVLVQIGFRTTGTELADAVAAEFGVTRMEAWDFVSAGLNSWFCAIWTDDLGETVFLGDTERREGFHEEDAIATGEPIIYGCGLVEMPEELRKEYDERLRATLLAQHVACVADAERAARKRAVTELPKRPEPQTGSQGRGARKTEGTAMLHVVPQPKSRLVSAAERRKRPKAKWAIEKRIPEHGVGQIYGETYTGESFVALDLALTIANGLCEWHGAPVNRAGAVVYVLMEGVFDFQQPIDAWLAAHPGMTDEKLYTLEEEDVDLANEESVRRIERDAELLSIEPVFFVIDTQSLATPGTDENSNTDMNLVFGNLKPLSARRRCPVATVHHTGYDTSRTRGASAQKAALDFQVRIEQ